MPILRRVNNVHTLGRRIEHALLLHVVRTVAIQRNPTPGVCKAFFVLAFDESRAR
jgi:hypothetical protein